MFNFTGYHIEATAGMQMRAVRGAVCIMQQLNALQTPADFPAVQDRQCVPWLSCGLCSCPPRLLALSDLQRLPVMYRVRLTRSQLTHVAFSPGGSCLAAAAAEECRVTLLGLRGCEQVDTLGYFTTPGVYCGGCNAMRVVSPAVWQFSMFRVCLSSCAACTT
jgi:hypothetical protein